MYQPNKICYIKQEKNCKIHALIVQNKKTPTICYIVGICLQ